MDILTIVFQNSEKIFTYSKWSATSQKYHVSVQTH